MAVKEGMDWLQRGIANAVVDIREKVVEEPWFGRKVTTDLPAPLAQAEQQDTPEPDPIHRTHSR